MIVEVHVGRPRQLSGMLSTHACAPLRRLERFGVVPRLAQDQVAFHLEDEDGLKAALAVVGRCFGDPHVSLADHPAQCDRGRFGETHAASPAARPGSRSAHRLRHVRLEVGVAQLVLHVGVHRCRRSSRASPRRPPSPSHLRSSTGAYRLPEVRAAPRTTAAGTSRLPGPRGPVATGILTRSVPRGVRSGRASRRTAARRARVGSPCSIVGASLRSSPVWGDGRPRAPASRPSTSATCNSDRRRARHRRLRRTSSEPQPPETPGSSSCVRHAGDVDAFLGVSTISVAGCGCPDRASTASAAPCSHPCGDRCPVSGARRRPAPGSTVAATSRTPTRDDLVDPRRSAHAVEARRPCEGAVWVGVIATVAR